MLLVLYLKISKKRDLSHLTNLQLKVGVTLGRSSSSVNSSNFALSSLSLYFCIRISSFLSSNPNSRVTLYLFAVGIDLLQERCTKAKQGVASTGVYRCELTSPHIDNHTHTRAFTPTATEQTYTRSPP